MTYLLVFLITLLSFMPHVADAAPVIIAAIVATSYTAAAGFAFSWFVFFSTLAIEAIGMLISKGHNNSGDTQLQDHQHVVRSSVEPHKIIYGHAMISGPLVFAASTSGTQSVQYSDGSTHTVETDDAYLHLVIVLTGHKVHQIGQVYFNDTPVGTINGDGSVTAAPYAGNAWVFPHLGDPAQAADAGLMAAFPGTWTYKHTLSGCAYLYIKLKYDSKIFNGIPNIKCEVYGKEVYDPRNGQTVYSSNWALCIRDYLTAAYGMNCSVDEIDDNSFIAAANSSDEQVPTDGIGNTQSRYTCDGVITLDRKPMDIMRDMVSAGAGTVAWAQGKYRIFPGVYTAPVYTLNEDDLRDKIKILPRTARKDLFNAVQGTFVDPGHSWQATDFPAVRSSFYVAEDNNEEIFIDISLPFTIDSTRAQRIAKIHLEKSRQGMVVTFPAKMTAFKLGIMDTVALNISQLGWQGKVFKVMDWKLGEQGGIDLVLNEETSAAYDWNNGVATNYDTAPDTNLPNPFVVAPPTSVVLSSGDADLLMAGDGTVISRIHVTWQPSSDTSVISNGSYDIQYRVHGTGTWVSASPAFGTQTDSYISPVVDSVAYDVRIRALNSLRSASNWVEIDNHTVIGKIAPPANVTGFQAYKELNYLVLAWKANTDIDLLGYEIREGNSWDSSNVVTTKFAGNMLHVNKSVIGTYQFHIRAMDRSGNYSALVTSVTISIGAPAAVTGFNVVQDSTDIAMIWNANHESDILAYEIREGTDWATAKYITQINGTRFTLPSYNIGGTRNFLIKAVESPGVYSDAASFATTAIAPSSDRNVLATTDEAATYFPANKYRATASGNTLIMNNNVGYGDYIFKVHLPQAYKARNALVTDMTAQQQDNLDWADASFGWGSINASRVWSDAGVISGLSLSSMISMYKGVDSKYVEQFSLSDTLTGLGGTAPAENAGVTYHPGRFMDGALITDTTTASWAVNVPAQFNLSHWFIPQDSGRDSALWSLTGGAGNRLTVGYRHQDNSFFLEDQWGNTVVVPFATTPGEQYLVTVVQNASQRKLMIGQPDGTNSYDIENFAPLGAFTAIKMYQV